jgi:uncharacterized delta-60 repeat protein
MRPAGWIAATVVVALILPATPATAAHPGRLDRTFGSGGTIVMPVGAGDAAAEAMVLDGEGRIVVGGYASNGIDDDMVVARYLTDGTPDPSFGSGGVVQADLGGADRAEALAIQADGDIVAAGFTGNEVAVVRFSPDGGIDRRFGGRGLALADFGGPESAEGVAVQPNGKIVVAGWVTSRQQGDMAVARFRPNGDLDRNFNGDGMYVRNLSSHDSLSAVAVQADGRIVAAGASGETSTQFAVLRLRRTGVPDKRFGDGTGVTVTPFPAAVSWGNALAVQPDGRICVGGFAFDGRHYRAALARYLPSGALDPGFGDAGLVVGKLGAGDATIQSLALQADGPIVAAGGKADDVAVARLTSEGLFDASFGSRGSASTDLGGLDGGTAVALQPDGRILVAGFSEREDVLAFALARYLA